ncbi:MAG TPA: DUF1840 domain-containing protein [Burkholderiales bacterium]|nr:DUF1840 domain-containing protein [Burkholderiales bacterium]
MLIRFNSKAGSITLFGEAAATLLRMMGQSGAIPGAILAPDIPAAVARLRNALNSGDVAPPEKTEDQADDKDVEPPIGMRQRAFPLIELLERAAKQNTAVIWEYETRTNL